MNWPVKSVYKKGMNKWIIKIIVIIIIINNNNNNNNRNNNNNHDDDDDDNINKKKIIVIMMMTTTTKITIIIWNYFYRTLQLENQKTVRKWLIVLSAWKSLFSKSHFDYS